MAAPQTALQKTLAKIQETQVLANSEVNEQPRDTYRGRVGRQKKAKEQLTALKETYRQDLLNSAVFIVVSGSSAMEFRDLSNAQGCFRADPNALYESLVSDIPTSLYGREGTGSLFDMMTRHLEDQALELGVIGYPQLQYKKEYQKTVKTKAEFLAVVKKAINDQVGAELVGIKAIKEIVDLAIDKGHKSKITPIILATDDASLALELDTALQRISSRVYLVRAGEGTLERADFDLPEVTEETVKKTHKTINASLKR